MRREAPCLCVGRRERSRVCSVPQRNACACVCTADEAEAVVAAHLVRPFLADTFTAGAVDGGVRGSFRNLPRLLGSDTLGFMRQRMTWLLHAAATCTSPINSSPVNSSSQRGDGRAPDLGVRALWAPLLAHLHTKLPAMWNPTFGRTFMHVRGMWCGA